MTELHVFAQAGFVERDRQRRQRQGSRSALPFDGLAGVFAFTITAGEPLRGAGDGASDAGETLLRRGP